MKIRHYANILYPGIIVTESQTVEIEARDIKKVKIPPSAVGVILYDILEDEIEYQGVKVETKSQELFSQKYYVGKFLSPEEIAKQYGEDSIFYNNIVNNGYCGAVVSRSGFSQGLYDEKDKEFIIDPDTLETDEDERE